MKRALEKRLRISPWLALAVAAAVYVLSDAHAQQPTSPAAVTASAQAEDWKLVWSDEFDKPGQPDPAKWDYEEGYIRNNERQYYTRARGENARVENGMLIIEARKEQFKNPCPGLARERQGETG